MQFGGIAILKKILVFFAALAVFIVTAAPIAEYPHKYLIRTDFDDDDNNILVWEIANAVNEVAWEYPEVRNILVSTEPIRMLGVYAAAISGERIIFNDMYMSSPTDIREMVAVDVKLRYHPPLGRCTGPQMLAYHEAAHIIDFKRGRVARYALKAKYGLGFELRKGLSGYSFNIFGLNAGEALAEAFAAVRCNGGTEEERELFHMLVDN